MWMKKIVVPNQGKANGLLKKHSLYGVRQYYVLFFVYTPSESVVLSGWFPEVMDYLVTNYPKCMYKITCWKNGKKLGYPWKLMDGKKVITIASPSKGLRRRQFIFTNMNGTILLKLRRIPYKWIKEYDMILSQP